MTVASSGDSGDEALRRDVEDGTLDEQKRNDRLTERWRRLARNLRALSEAKND